MNSRSFNQLIQYALFCFVFLSACKKDSPNLGNTKQTPTTDRVALTNDSIFLYAKEIYYWNDNLPSYDDFNPRQYTAGSTDLAKYEINLLNIAGYSSSNKYDILSSNNKDETKFSYIEDVSGNGGVSAGIRNLTSSVNLQGEGNDIGIYFVGAYGPSDNDYKVFIQAVYPGSPAAKAGLTRGATITKIGNEVIGDNFDLDQNAINQLLNDPFSIRIEGEKVDGTAYAVSLAKTTYDSSPIYKDTVLSAGGKKIGYLAYARFSNDDNSLEPLNNVFQKFATQGVQDLVIDLRYNGGGYVTTAQHLANLIVPTGTTGTMFVEQYNTTMQQGKATILKNQPVRNSNGDIIGRDTYGDYGYDLKTNTKPFEKKGNLTGVKNVVFLVTGSTASASELVINSLRAVPSLTVKLVGTTTYGKPVGFFPVRLEGIYDLYLASFSTKNANGEGDYYDGLTPGNQIAGKIMLDGQQQDLDTFSDYDFGDTHELYLAEALNQLGVVSSTSTSNTVMSVRTKQGGTSPALNLMKGTAKKKEFKGMIETRIGKN
ncbi:S41 family peptidase [Olivibacter domesticus]|nr:S41 family peptidase [Olivibacter domesticus]